MMLADCGQDFVTDPNLLALACEDAEVFGDWVMPDYRRIAAELGRTPESTVFSIEDSDYGSGWASFVEIRLARRGAEPEIRDGYQVTPVRICDGMQNRPVGRADEGGRGEGGVGLQGELWLPSGIR